MAAALCWDKLLELLVVRFSDRWWDNNIVSRLPGMTPEQAFQRYARTVDEVMRVLHAPEVETPREWDTQLEEVAAAPPAGTTAVEEMPSAAADVTVASVGEEAAAVTEKAREPTSPTADAKTSTRRASRRKKVGENRKKPEKWTLEEHRLFLEGLEKYKGKWKAMSSEYLTTKSASQIASHHQKHCKRLEQRKRNGCKRPTIHDITEPTSAAAAVLADYGGGEPSAQEDERGSGVGSNSPGELVGADEEFFDDEFSFEELFSEHP